MLKGTRLKIAHPYLATIKPFEIVFRESIVLMLCNIVVYLTILDYIDLWNETGTFVFDGFL